MGPHDEPQYVALVARAAASPFSHTLAYRDVLHACGAGQPIYLLARHGQSVRAAMPTFVQRSPLGVVLNSLPLVQSAGGIVFCPDLSPPERAQIRDALASELSALARRESLNVCVVIGTPYSKESLLPFDRAPDFSLVRTTHVLALGQPLQLHHSAQQALRKAARAAPVHRVAETLGEAQLVWSLYAQNMERIGVAARGWELYAQLYLRGGQQVRFVWAEVGGEPASGLVLLCHGEVVDYHSVGNTETGRSGQIATWLCVQELQRAQSLGARWWNWGVSPTAAVAAFKRSFGGWDQPYAISGLCTGPVESWKTLPPSALSQHFPDHFVLPYGWLTKEPA